MIHDRRMPLALTALPSIVRLCAAVRSVALDCLALVLPVDCAGCGAVDRSLCDLCRDRLNPDPRARVLGDGTILVSGLRYDGVARDCMIALKQRGRTDAADGLAPALAAAVSSAVAAAFAADRDQRSRQYPVLVCAVPSRAASTRSRGYSPVSLLCQRAIGIRPRALLRLREGGANQKTLGVAARLRNVDGALSAITPLDGRRVLIVDDVATTGATILDAARAIREAGGYVVAAVVVADTPLRNDHR